MENAKKRIWNVMVSRQLRYLFGTDQHEVFHLWHPASSSFFSQTQSGVAYSRSSLPANIFSFLGPRFASLFHSHISGVNAHACAGGRSNCTSPSIHVPIPVYDFVSPTLVVYRSCFAVFGFMHWFGNTFPWFGFVIQRAICFICFELLVYVWELCIAIC